MSNEKEINKEWEKLGIWGGKHAIERISSFIDEKIASAVEAREREISEEVEKMRKEEKNLPEVKTEMDLWEICENNRNIGGNDVIEKVIAIINPSKE